MIRISWTEHSFIDIYSFTLLRVSFLLCIVKLRLSTLNKPISDLIWTQDQQLNIRRVGTGMFPGRS